MANNGVKIVCGLNVLLSDSTTIEQTREWLDVLEKEGIDTIDTAQVYGPSERLLGEAGASSRFIIDTKHCGGAIPGQSTMERVIARGLESIENLKTDSVDVFYIHVPDRRTPLEETLAGINELYKAGKFKRFGLSNYLANDIEDVMRISKQHNYVLPTVYQSNYSAVARRQEAEIFPILDKYKIAFYAYSPLAGGFLTKTVDQVLNSTTGRWDPNTFLGKTHRKLYQKTALLSALKLWEEISDKYGISKSELGYRWIVYNSHLSAKRGDAVVIGASSITQLQQTMKGLSKGPLSEEVAKAIDQVWEISKSQVHLDNIEGISSVL